MYAGPGQRPIRRLKTASEGGLLYSLKGLTVRVSPLRLVLHWATAAAWATMHKGENGSSGYIERATGAVRLYCRSSGVSERA